VFELHLNLRIIREQKWQLQQQPSSARALEAQISQELVASRVLQEATSRRMAILEGERDRVQRSLKEAQVNDLHSCSRHHESSDSNLEGADSGRINMKACANVTCCPW
jgi:hypothetical protein